MSAWNSLSKSIKEVRVHFCQTSPASKGLKQFVAENYTGIKQANPNLPFLIREANGVQPRIFARFDKGVERKVTLENASVQDVKNALENLAKLN
ncbi:hypothetical protein INT44_004153 [Umbelopsis vinacea]|uniref:Ribosomal protein/NADH dehydrogenase domain-containing protein n=1 Tax=Umbelopsis vinacea TaxID=44442 RepID=A0A8H7QAV4_9FUNG|nr:hypothetical protein INT44_004153 [Umbelopsis vinacea]KAI9287104.1 thioredoxin-like protein [Umbelopsis sp. AD052]